jgi:hypothetical protein
VEADWKACAMLSREAANWTKVQTPIHRWRAKVNLVKEKWRAARSCIAAEKNKKGENK